MKAQPNSTDTIAYARSLAYQKNFQESDRLLTSYNLHHTDPNALRLHAQVLYWMKEFDRSSAVYEKIMTRFPKLAEAKLDYGRMLFNLNKLPKAQLLLQNYLLNDSLNAEAHTLLSYVDLWTGHVNAAKAKAKQILQYDPGNLEALGILDQIKAYRAPYVSAGVGFESDDQPRTGRHYSLETGVYRSWLLAPVLQGQFNEFQVQDRVYRSVWIQTGNKVSLGTRLTLNLTGGIFQHALDSGNSYFTGKVGITQKLGRYFSAAASIEQSPYLYSVASLQKPVMERSASGTLSFNKNDNWLGKASFLKEHFNDNNQINSTYCWLLLPLVNQNTVSLKGGYAFSYANADNNNFTARERLSSLVGSTGLHGSVPGIYDPYFTPQDQVIHSILGSMTLAFSKQLRLTTRVSIGVWARAYNPELTLERKGTSQYYVSKRYSSITYTPVEWVSDFQLACSKSFSLFARYTYSKLLFYTKNQGGLQLKYTFLHDDKNETRPVALP